MPTANSLKVFRSLFQIMYRLYRGVVFIFSTCHTSVVFPYFPLSLFDVITDFLSRTLYVTIVHYPLPHTVLCINEPSQSVAADDVLFMQQITGDTGSGLQGYAPDAFLHFPGISRVRRSQRERGAEDFSLTRGISAAELTHIDHKRKRMPRYFKPLQGT